MDRYELLKFVHISAAIVWLGGVVTLQFVAIRTRGRRAGVARR
jgi:putative copper export protein